MVQCIITICSGGPHLRKPFHLGQLLAECAAALTQCKETLITVRASLHRLLNNRAELARLIEQGWSSVGRATEKRPAEGRGDGAAARPRPVAD